MGYRTQTVLTAFTDGAEGLYTLPEKAAGKPVTPTLDWFHIAMRLQHLSQVASGFRTRTYHDERFKTKVEREVERLRWRLWHGRRNGVRKAMNRLKHSFGRFRVRNTFEGRSNLNEGPRKFWPHLSELDRYVCTSALLIANYHRRYHAGQRLSTALVESTVNSLVNQRMNKRRHMRWSAPGAARLLRVRTALANGELTTTVWRPLTTPCDTSMPTLQLAA